VVSHKYDAEAERLTLTVRQDLPETPDRMPKHPMHIPVAFGLVGPDGQDLSFASADGAAVADNVLNLTTGSAEVVFQGVRARAVPSLFREFSAPVHVQSDLSTEERLFLLGRDPDPFNRWEAAQQLALTMLESATATIRAGESPSFDPRFGEELGRLADDDGLDPAFRALALALPSEIDIAQGIGRNIDPDAIHAARRALEVQLGQKIGPLVAEAAARMPPARPFSPDSDSAGRRAFTHAAWALGAAGGSMMGRDLTEFYRTAENLTDRLAALRILVHQEMEGAEDALRNFCERYQDTPLVLDKWFAVQATTPNHETLDRVENLGSHPSFSFKNPNRIYSLIRSFAAANPVGFNRPDGAGYRYLAGIIGTLDGQNPSVAARLATAFRSFRMLEPERQNHAKEALASLQQSGRLSRDVSDIVQRTLQG
jgi:aminopeptidase N